MAVRRTDLASLIQSRGFRRLQRSRRLEEFLSWLRVAQKYPRGAVQYPRCWNHARPKDSHCPANGAGKFPQSLRFVDVHPAPFSPFGRLQPFFPVLRPVLTSSSLLVLLLFLLLFRNYVEGGGERGSELSEGGREREKGEEGGVAKKLGWFQPGALWKIWHPLLICSSKNPSGEGMLKEKKKKNPRIGQALKTWVLKAVDLHRSLF